MAKATAAAIDRRIGELVPLLTDGMTLRQIRAYTLANCDWGPLVSEVQLKRYLQRARLEIRAAAAIDRAYELALAKLRYERTLTRAAAKGDRRTYLQATRELVRLCGLGLAAERPVSIDVEALRARFTDTVAQEIADGHPDA
jgi:hypothetical protein